MKALDTAGEQIQHALLRDRFPLRRMWNQLKKGEQQKKSLEQVREKFQQRLQQSLDTVQQRKMDRPPISFSQDLPIHDCREEIAATILQNQVVVISGETGSGKSTQLPKICLDAGLGTVGLIGHTQPRRIAARTVAHRIAEELQRPLGQEIGYKIRFTDKSNPRTLIKLMTDGILLAETQGDRFLNQYEVLIIDEAHERSLNIDFLLGYIKRLLPKRPELRVVITSATIDAERFSQHFSQPDQAVPMLSVSGRNFPVEVRYQPPEGKNDEAAMGLDELNGIVAAVLELAAIDHGHILIFLPTEREIREVAKRLRTETLPGDRSQKTEILPLYARLSAADQNRVFEPSRRRRIVLATNVAESSLTVPGIRYVIDTGTARISRYAPRSKVQRLPIEAISRASADQRKGRCGRVAAGICIRLYDEDDFESRAPYTTPEIQRTNLAAVILQALSLGLGRVEDFPFLDVPRPEAIRDGYNTLFELGAIDNQRKLTDIGRRLSRLPLDPRIGRIIVAADENNCLSEILIIAAALAIQDPRERPLEHQEAADQAHSQFTTEGSDYLGYFKLWDFYHQQKEKLSRNKLRKACQQNFLSANRLREWTEIHRQLRQLMTTGGLTCRSRKDDPESIHRCLLSGYLSGIAHRTGDREYTGAGGVKFYIWPGSSLFDSKPKWCVVAELVETNRRYGRTAGIIQPNWVEPLAKHLVQHHYSEPHFHQKSGTVMAFERVTLFGLPIVQRRRAPYARIAPEESREIFLRDGLAGRQLETNLRFYHHNEQLLEQIDAAAKKTRRTEYVIDTFSIQQFYEERVPKEVVDITSLRRWLQKNKTEHPDRLHMQLSDFAIQQETLPRADAFPEQLEIGNMKLPVAYEFAPGNDDDGINLTVPEEALAQIPPSYIEWAVPGLLEEKVIALIRSLPKSIRRNVIPAPDTARLIAGEIIFGQGDFLAQVASCLSKVAGETIPVNAFRLEKISPHLQMNVRVVDGQGVLKKQGRDLVHLQRGLPVQPSLEFTGDEEQVWHRDKISCWDFGELPSQVSLLRGNIVVDAFPALVDAKHSVCMRLVRSFDQAQRMTRAGLRRLFVLGQKKQLRSQVNWLPHQNEISVWASPLMQPDSMKEQVTDLIADLAFLEPEKNLPTDETEFNRRLSDAVERISVATQDVAKLLPRLFETHQESRLAIEQNSNQNSLHAVEDIQEQLQHLFADGFLVSTPWRWLQEIPRYCKAIVYRLDKLNAGSLARDREATSELNRFWQCYTERLELHEACGKYDCELELYRWMIEEYRVSVFAQPLGTVMSVSAKRLDKQWTKVS